MAEATTDVLVAGYQTVDKATTDFDGLIGLVKGKRVTIDAAIQTVGAGAAG